jgi:phosphoesterase RecJ-like protein
LNLETLEQFIQEDGPIILTTHENPDGDGISAQVGLHALLVSQGKSVKIVNNDPLPDKYRFMDTEGIVAGGKLGKLPKDFHLIVLDTTDSGHMGKIGRKLLDKAKKTYFIDHHNGMDRDVAQNWIDSSRSSTAEMICDLASHYKFQFPLHISRALFAGIVYDTGSFIYPKTSSHTLEVASDLVRGGVKPKEIHSLLYENKPASSFKLLALIQATFTTDYDDKLAIQVMTKGMLKKAGAEYEASENVINYPLKCPEILVSVFFKEDHEGKWRASIRSKGNIDVAAFSQELGGGGHKNAAGFPLDLQGKSVEEREVIIQSIVKKLGPLLT